MSTKVDLATESRCRPTSLLVTAGQAGDAPQFAGVMDAISVPRRGPGRSRRRQERVLADKAYSSRAIREWLRRRGRGHDPAAVRSEGPPPTASRRAAVAAAAQRHRTARRARIHPARSRGRT
ncbi:transposase [Krasilnikovia sp. M28-CT-15]|uniref:transposase n=1 Tax=Krasilnikovia sp. M28-CT-15 TaxID=3373540 RepID=UPI00399CB08E